MTWRYNKNDQENLQKIQTTVRNFTTRHGWNWFVAHSKASYGAHPLAVLSPNRKNMSSIDADKSRTGITDPPLPIYHKIRNKAISQWISIRSRQKVVLWNQQKEEHAMRLWPASNQSNHRHSRSAVPKLSLRQSNHRRLRPPELSSSPTPVRAIWPRMPCCYFATLVMLLLHHAGHAATPPRLIGHAANRPHTCY